MVYGEGERKAEILDTAARLFGEYGLQTSLDQIAEASGILTGSLYHHFESRDAILVGLVERFHAELDYIAASALDEHQLASRPAPERIVALGTAIADCAVRHRAAVLLTFYDPATGASSELVRATSLTPTAIQNAMLETLRAARSSGYLRPWIDVELLADRIYQSMLNIGIGVYHRSGRVAGYPQTKLWMLLHGVAVRSPDDAELDCSTAMRVADEAIQSWSDQEDQDPRMARILGAARSEFARRGFEATTVRDIAAAARYSTGGIYRWIESKDKVFATIMDGYTGRVMEGKDRILHSSSSPVEKLDALLWFKINLLDRFSDEHRIEIWWLRQSPPIGANVPWPFPRQLRQVKDLLSIGVQARQLQIVEGASMETSARCLFDLYATPESVIRRAGTRGAHRFARDTVLRGASQRA